MSLTTHCIDLTQSIMTIVGSRLTYISQFLYSPPKMTRYKEYHYLYTPVWGPLASIGRNFAHLIWPMGFIMTRYKEFHYLCTQCYKIDDTIVILTSALCKEKVRHMRTLKMPHWLGRIFRSFLYGKLLYRKKTIIYKLHFQ